MSPLKSHATLYFQEIFSVVSSVHLDSAMITICSTPFQEVIKTRFLFI